MYGYGEQDLRLVFHDGTILDTADAARRVLNALFRAPRSFNPARACHPLVSGVVEDMRMGACLAT